MSSDEKPKVSILDLRNKGKKGRKAKTDDNTFRRTVRSDHGYPRITFPKWLVDLGLALNSEVIIEKRGDNLLNYEIVIKPARNLKKHSKLAEQ